MPTQLTLLLEGVAATVLVALQVVAWIGLGAPAVRGLRRPELEVPVALLVGAALTAFVDALLAAAGHVTLAIVASALVSAFGLAARGRWAVRGLRGLFAESLALVRANLATRVAAIVCFAVAWFLAISPPRDADVMRYHLAHIRQIVLDGRWTSIPDFTYAIPFGWSFNYLPFERAGLAVGANLLSLVLALVLLAVLLSLARRVGTPASATLALGLLVLQPEVVKALTTAHADAYAMLLTAVVVALLLELADGRDAASGALGFVAFVGLQDRYQSAAVAIAATSVVLVWLVRRRVTGRVVRPYALGALAAVVLASPFYVMNLVDLHDPFWPLFSGSSTYADRVVTAYRVGLDGTFGIARLERGVHTLLVERLVFPIPLAALAVLVGLVVLPKARRRVPGFLVFCVVFFVVWGISDPNLYSRFVLLVAPAVAVGGAAVAGRVRPALAVAAAVVVLLPLAAFDAYYAGDTARLFTGGDLAAYQRYTWYYPVYTWVNNHTPASSRDLVIVQAGLSYYLDRPYRRADPFLSGVVDWDAVGGAHALAQVLARGHYSYVIYDASYHWSEDTGGAHMERALAAGRRTGLLRLVAHFNVPLYTSRVRRSSVPASVDVFAVRPAG